MTMTTPESNEIDTPNSAAVEGDTNPRGLQGSSILPSQPEDDSGSSSSHPRKTSSSRRRRASVYASTSYVPGVKIRLFSPPRQRQKWGSSQVLPHVNWGDLFFDLFYVAAFYNLGNILVENPSPIGLLYFCGCFFPILALWNQKTLYDSQFTYGDDIFHKLFETAVLVVMATNVSSIATVNRMSNPDRYVDMFSFSIGVTLSTLLHCGRYIESYFFGRGQRKNIAHVATSSLQYQILPLAFYIAATCVSGWAHFSSATNANAAANEDAAAYDNETTTTPSSNYTNEDDFPWDNDPNRALAGESTSAYEDCYSQTHLPIILLLAGFLSFQLGLILRVVFFYPKHGDHKKFTIPMNIDFAIHRYGELAMLVLGESVLSLLIVDGDEGNYHFTFYFGILTVIGLQWLHFQSQPHDADAHAMRRHKNAGILFGQAFPMYSAALIAVGASYKLLMYDVSSSSYGRRRLLGDGLREFPNLATGSSRWLAGGDSNCGPYGEEKQQMVANLFSGSMAICFFLLDVMLLAHVGLQKEVDRCKYGVECERTGTTKIKYNLKGMLLVVVPRVGITIFVATLSLWETNPRMLAGLGLASVVGQLTLRFLGNIWFPHTDFRGHGGPSHGVADDEEEEECISDDEQGGDREAHV